MGSRSVVVHCLLNVKRSAGTDNASPEFGLGGSTIVQINKGECHGDTAPPLEEC